MAPTCALLAPLSQDLLVARAKAAAEIVAMDVRGRGTYVGVLKEGEVDAAVLTAQIKDAGERLEAARAHVAAKEEALPTHLKVSGALEDLRQAEVYHTGAMREVEELESQIAALQVSNQLSSPSCLILRVVLCEIDWRNTRALMSCVRANKEGDRCES